MFQELMTELAEKNIQNYPYSLLDIYDITNKILTTVSFYPGHCATPVVKIAKAFGFVLYQEGMSDGQYGRLYIGNESIDKYGKEKTLVVNRNISKFQQRYMVALQLGNYLLKYLGTEKQLNFEQASKDEVLGQFVLELLMPRELFREQYLIASKSGNPMFTETYLSRYFEVPVTCVLNRIRSLT